MPVKNILQREISYIHQKIAELQTNWPNEASLSLEALPSVYDFYPYIFLEAFPPLSAEDIRLFATAIRLLASAIFLLDKVLDASDGASENRRSNELRVVSLLWEAMLLLSREFEATSKFWEYFRNYLSEHVNACLLEGRLDDVVSLSPQAAEARLLAIAIGKNGVSRTAIAGLAEMAQNYQYFDALVESVNKYNLAHQLLDDVVDWKDDFEQRRLSLLLYRAIRAPSSEWNGLTKEVLARKIFYEGHALAVLAMGIDSLEEAQSIIINDIPVPLWSEVLDGLYDRIFSLRRDLEKTIEKNINFARKRSVAEVSPPDLQNHWQHMAWKGIEFILRQWQKGFGELVHYMGFPQKRGLVEKHNIQSGDVFQRALVAEILQEINSQWLGGQLDALVEQEIRYLIEHRYTQGVGGWKYFPAFEELPPDADTLAQVMRVFLYAQREDLIQQYCIPPLKVLLHDNMYEDGSFETWIIPHQNRTIEQEKQREAARLAWGTGPDPDVMGNLLYTLALYDEPTFRETINKGINYLEQLQTSQRYWKSTRYVGYYYGTYVITRLLVHISPYSDSLRQALEFLRTTQSADGGWGDNFNTRALSTALALLSLAQIAPLIGDVTDKKRARKGFEFLHELRNPDGGWGKDPFIRMDLGRGSGHTKGHEIILTYGSRTITTAFVVKAILSWKFLQ